MEDALKEIERLVEAANKARGCSFYVQYIGGTDSEWIVASSGGLHFGYLTADQCVEKLEELASQSA